MLVYDIRYVMKSVIVTSNQSVDVSLPGVCQNLTRQVDAQCGDLVAQVVDSLVRDSQRASQGTKCVHDLSLGLGGYDVETGEALRVVTPSSLNRSLYQAGRMRFSDCDDGIIASLLALVSLGRAGTE